MELFKLKKCILRKTYDDGGQISVPKKKLNRGVIEKPVTKTDHVDLTKCVHDKTDLLKYIPNEDLNDESINIVRQTIEELVNEGYLDYKTFNDETIYQITSKGCELVNKNKL